MNRTLNMSWGGAATQQNYGASYGGGQSYGGGGGGGYEAPPQGGATVTVQLQKMDPMQSWGFRLAGGRDFRQQLSVKKVYI